MLRKVSEAVIRFSTNLDSLFICQSQTDERILKVRDFAELRFFFSIKCIESVSYYTFMLRNPQAFGTDFEVAILSL